MTLGPPGRDADSRCLRRAKRTRAGSFSSSSAWRVGDVGFGGDREPRAGALDEISRVKVGQVEIRTQSRKKLVDVKSWRVVCRGMSCDRDVCLDQEVSQKMTCNRDRDRTRAHPHHPKSALFCLLLFGLARLNNALTLYLPQSNTIWPNFQTMHPNYLHSVITFAYMESAFIKRD